MAASIIAHILAVIDRCLGNLGRWRPRVPQGERYGLSSVLFPRGGGAMFRHAERAGMFSSSLQSKNKLELK